MCSTDVVLYAGRFRSKEKRLQNVTCLAQMAQRAVAGHIAGIVQERHSTAAASVAVAQHEDRPSADHLAVSPDNPVHIEEAVLPPPKSAQTRDIADSPRVQVPVELLVNAAGEEACLHSDDRVKFRRSADVSVPFYTPRRLHSAWSSSSSSSSSSSYFRLFCRFCSCDI